MDTWSMYQGMCLPNLVSPLHSLQTHTKDAQKYESKIIPKQLLLTLQ